MTLTVETGLGLASSDSYASLTDAATYTVANGLTWPVDVTVREAALRRATAWIDATFRVRFPGYRLNGRLQSLEWPRSGAYLPITGGSEPAPSYSFSWQPNIDALNLNRFDLLPPNAVPPEIVKATIEAAVREAVRPGVLMGDVEVTGRIKKQAAGDTSQEFFDAAPPTSNSGGFRFPIIDALLSGILIQQSGYTARAVRR